jgi:hypothetical protein
VMQKKNSLFRFAVDLVINLAVMNFCKRHLTPLKRP